MTPPNFNLYTKQEFLARITARLDKLGKGDRAALATMSFDPHYPAIAKLVAGLEAAARRGATVHLAVDAYIFLKGRASFAGPLLLHNTMPKRLRGEFAEKAAVLESLAAAGVVCTLTNQPKRAFSNPFGGRSHIKYAVIDSEAYIGGCNLDNPDNMDVMAGRQDQQLAAYLHNFANDTRQAAGTAFMEGSDRTVALAGASLVIDAGVRGQSLILQQALDLIDSARAKLLITSQFFPNGVTARHILAAHKRGVAVTILYNHPSKFTKNERLPQYVHVAWSKLRMPTELTANQLPKTSPYLHSKIIATESAAMVGSHNYVQTGVTFGTAEIALKVDSADFLRQVAEKIRLFAG